MHRKWVKCIRAHACYAVLCTVGYRIVCGQTLRNSAPNVFHSTSDLLIVRVNLFVRFIEISFHNYTTQVVDADADVSFCQCFLRSPTANKANEIVVTQFHIAMRRFRGGGEEGERGCAIEIRDDRTRILIAFARRTLSDIFLASRQHISNPRSPNKRRTVPDTYERRIE